MKMQFLVVVLCLVACGSATQVKNCGSSDKKIDNLSDVVTVGSCNKPPCRLRKNSVVNVVLKFKPDHNVNKLVNTVNANILGVPFPFVGVDGENACGNIYQKDGSTKVEGCKLKAGEEYVYKSNIEVLQIYPRIKTVVHWGLTEPNGKDVICFEVPARITN